MLEYNIKAHDEITLSVKLISEDHKSDSPQDSDDDSQEELPLENPDIEPGAEFSVFVKAITGSSWEFKVFQNQTIWKLAVLIQEKQGVYPEQLRFESEGRKFRHWKTFFDYKLKDGDLIHLTLKLRR